MRRGEGLVHLIGGMFVGSLVLSLCVPLYFSAQRHADAGVARARMAEQARQLSSRLREDIRQSVSVQVLNHGTGLQLVRAHPDGSRDLVRYVPAPGGLTRTYRPTGGNSRQPEDEVFRAPLALARFGRQGEAVRAQMFFEQRVGGRRLAFSADCLVAPRAEEGR